MKTTVNSDPTQTPINLPVVVRFPRMVAPFKSCEPYKESKASYKVLTLNFDGEKDRSDLREFRMLQESVQRQLMLLCMHTEGENTNSLPNVHSLIHAPKKRAYSDLMNIKFIPQSVTWVDETGNPIQYSDIIFGDMEVEIVAQLVDVFKFVHPHTKNVTYFPRYFLRQCKLLTKEFVPEFKMDLVEIN